MAKNAKTGITPTREEDYSEWYQQIVRAAEMAETSAVRGCMVIKPWGYQLWENMKAGLDKMFKETGHVNAYFPLFIPLSYLEKEAEHVEGFAKECAVVTHHRLEDNGEGKLIPTGELEEPLIVRPTSETIIGATYAKWVQSYRDLPILINQWANVVRWEMRTRLFLRTAEFLWQEGHTVHETSEEAWQETKMILDLYKKFAEEYMAIPVITGEKTPGERFPGAVNTLCIEAMMQDRKALQAGTSHFLGQNFSKASEIKYQSRSETIEYTWTTSWGVSTRLVGALIMVHGDDDGMVMPPRIAPAQIVLLPIIKNEEQKPAIMAYCQKITDKLKQQTVFNRSLEVEIDTRDINTGQKSWNWIKKGIPIRVEVGPRDMENNSVFIARRDKGPKEKFSLTVDEFIQQAPVMLEDMQNQLFKKAKQLLDDNSKQIDQHDEFYQYFTAKNKNKPELHGGFAYSHWCQSEKCEEKIKSDLSVTIRCIPFDQPAEKGKCICCGKESSKRVVFAKSY
ncbi:MAG: proline--tRNA ligase [Spirochaetes bacterium]|nr:proline--tRNA ligase [Spirochaetota bacterium]